MSEIDAGDALATATRFDREWAYRGGQALLWKRSFAAREVHEFYLPLYPLRPFDRRGLLRVDGTYWGAELHLLATQFASDRSAIRDLRFARTAIRAIEQSMLAFVCEPVPVRAGFRDLGLRVLLASRDLMVCGRGWSLESQGPGDARRGLGSVAVLRATRV